MSKNRTRNRTKYTYEHTGFVLTLNNIPTTIAPALPLPPPMRLAMGLFPPHPLHLRPPYELEGGVLERFFDGEELRFSSKLG